LLENYVRQGSQFSFEYVDPQSGRLAEKFGVKQFGEVYLEVGQQRRLLQVVNEQERLSEVRLTNGLQQITVLVAPPRFISCHGEHPLRGQVHCRKPECVRRENYTVQPLNLTQQPAIPKDATVVVVAGPSTVAV